MIDISTEHVFALAKASRLVDKHVATLYRWTVSGIRGVILESIQIGGTRCTSHEAIQRFAAALSIRQKTGEPAPATRSAIQRTRASEAAAKELASKYGI